MNLFDQLTNCVMSCARQIDRLHQKQKLIIAGAICFYIWEKSQDEKIKKLNTELDELKKAGEKAKE